MLSGKTFIVCFLMLNSDRVFDNIHSDQLRIAGIPAVVRGLVVSASLCLVATTCQGECK